MRRSACSSSAANMPNKPSCPLIAVTLARLPASMAPSTRQQTVARECRRKRIHCACANQAFHHAAIDGAQDPPFRRTGRWNGNGPLPYAPRESLPRRPAPTFFTAPRPKRMASPSVRSVKLQSLAFTSGGNTLMFISRHSLMYFTTLRNVAGFRGEQRGHEVYRVMRFQVRRHKG